MNNKPNNYRVMQDQHQRLYNQLPIRHVYNKEQLEAAKIHFKAKTLAELRTIPGTGEVYHQRDAIVIKTTLDLMAAQHREAIRRDKTGAGYIYDMFITHMRNTDYYKLRDVWSIIAAAKLEPDSFGKSQALRDGFALAEKDYLEENKSNMNYEQKVRSGLL